MLNFFKAFESGSYQPLNKITIASANITHNYHYLRKLNMNLDLAPVLKSNAYGHGIAQMAKIVDEFDVPFIAVDSLFEAYELLKAGSRKQILIMGYIDPESLSVKKLPFAYAVSDIDYATAVSKYQPHAEIHIFVDTGMRREGVLLSELPSLLARFKTLNSRVVGVMSHFAAADEKASRFTEQQTQEFNQAVKLITDAGFAIKYKHISASAGLLSTANLNYNVARSGIALYGYNPVQQNFDLRPALRLSTKIAQIKQINQGDRVGYNGTFAVAKPAKIGILPIGYANGVDRRLSNQGYVKVGDRFCPIVGRISMNICTVDLSQAANTKVGDTVILFSEMVADRNSISRSANLANTISYDLLTGLDPTIRREIIN
jgi:alanine racemase